VLPPSSPTIKTIHRQRMVSSEPRKTTTNSPSTRTSTIQRRLPFERMMLLKNNNSNSSKYISLI
jgi:hypothetical protein